MLTSFWLPCILMGFGIAIDVTIVTLTRYRDKDLSFTTWTLPIMLTHTSFPAFGCYLFWTVAQILPSMSLILGVIGFILVALFVYEVVCESANIEPVFGIAEWFSQVIDLDENDARRLIAILAVSWDAPWSGPAMAMQAEAAAWSVFEILSSFLVIGVTVAIVTQLALVAAKGLRAINFTNAVKLARFNFWGKLVELSVIGGFGVLALWHGLSGQGNLYQSILISTCVLLIVFFWLRHSIMNNELRESNEAVMTKQACEG